MVNKLAELQSRITTELFYCFFYWYLDKDKDTPLAEKITRWETNPKNPKSYESWVERLLEKLSDHLPDVDIPRFVDMIMKKDRKRCVTGFDKDIPYVPVFSDNASNVRLDVLIAILFVYSHPKFNKVHMAKHYIHLKSCGNKQCLNPYHLKIINKGKDTLPSIKNRDDNDSYSSLHSSVIFGPDKPNVHKIDSDPSVLPLFFENLTADRIGRALREFCTLNDDWEDLTTMPAVLKRWQKQIYGYFIKNLSAVNLQRFFLMINNRTNDCVVTLNLIPLIRINYVTIRLDLFLKLLMDGSFKIKPDCHMDITCIKTCKLKNCLNPKHLCVVKARKRKSLEEINTHEDDEHYRMLHEVSDIHKKRRVADKENDVHMNENMTDSDFDAYKKAVQKVDELTRVNQQLSDINADEMSKNEAIMNENFELSLRVGLLESRIDVLTQEAAEIQANTAGPSRTPALFHIQRTP